MKSVIRLAILVIAFISVQLALPSVASAACGGGASTCFWVGGAGTWDNADTTHWSSTSNGSNGAGPPAATDSVTFDGSSGGGTVTVAATINASNTVASINQSAHTGTLDFSANNPSLTMNFFVSNGSATRTLNCGTGTFTLNGYSVATTSSSQIWNTNGTNLTESCTGVTLSFYPAATPTGLLYITIRSGEAIGTITFPGGTNANVLAYYLVTGTTGTITNFNVTGPQALLFANNTWVITNLTISGTSTNQVTLMTGGQGYGTVPTTFTVTNAPTINWATLYGITFTNAATANNSFDGTHNTNVTINKPASGGGGGRIIGG